MILRDRGPRGRSSSSGEWRRLHRGGGESLLGEFLLVECLNGLFPCRGEFRGDVSCLLG
ncbi:hypothetical protein A2U01_0078276, partial [Trifolium medium]|nr:hypothetical protein [Trifolium medium]